VIRIVLADDHTIVRQGLRSLLERTGEVTVVHEASDGEEALVRLLEPEIDVGLVDVRMPLRTGVEVVHALRERGHAVPIILLTTFDDEAMLLAAVREGISGYLLKDIGAPQLLDALRVAASGGTTILPAVTERAKRFFAGRETSFESADLPDALTPRELEVLRLIAAGYSNREIAHALGTAEGTVKNQTSSILGKLGVRDRTRAVLKALEMGWLLG
jgi:DNA-binding NarL/FixJ family response regulator